MFDVTQSLKEFLKNMIKLEGPKSDDSLFDAIGYPWAREEGLVSSQRGFEWKNR